MSDMVGESAHKRKQNAAWKEVYVTHGSQRGGHCVPCKATRGRQGRQEAEGRSEGEARARAFSGVSTGRPGGRG